MIQIQSFTFNPFAENTYVLHDLTGEALIVDPGNYQQQEHDVLTRYLEERSLKPIRIVNTHAHIDHVLGVSFLKYRYELPFSLHPDDAPLLRAVKTYAPNYGFPAFDEPEVEQWLHEGDTVTFGSSSLRVLHVPGHAPGHLALVNDEQRFVIGGDVLFRQSIGRTDLPGGDYDTLIASIRTKLFTLPDDYTVYAGHMEPTTIGYEKKYNPFLK
ncbi:MBL fold metallo-hydrolase [Rhabdobacter roseus]|uniref:Glyoxylase-like metal-dependent hydrolase (Beta-lactamase superfamily II) n=1 Tax=Rhabdobacter roseus TaxID=1655419 RepID=A0A840TQL9_9BACT|nr:MBL fold metallo-hydrolase [Rhabdobacter roseus]MBB5285205.1 glyoxylase-like metal-dependent hydrolase (beta-lactamase superfamily II) [Rhabdobacter roseus]